MCEKITSNDLPLVTNVKGEYCNGLDEITIQMFPACKIIFMLLSGVPDYFGLNKISSGGDLSHYSSASLY